MNMFFGDNPKMTVGELIDILSKYKKTQFVEIEGGEGFMGGWAVLKIGVDEIMSYSDM